jgi:hypothetical protein
MSGPGAGGVSCGKKETDVKKQGRKVPGWRKVPVGACKKDCVNVVLQENEGERNDEPER